VNIHSLGARLAKLAGKKTQIELAPQAVVVTGQVL
jgi:hypothetical protein